MRLVARIGGSLLIGAGALGLGWALLVWRWQDPFTALYSAHKQARLSDSYARLVASYRPSSSRTTARAAANLKATSAAPLVRREADRFRRTLRPGQPLGRLRVPRLGLSAVVVAGTDVESLKKGPGWYTGSFLPGEGELVYVAGHRTTYLAPFARIDRLQPGDLVRLEMPYATFLYRVRRHVIVPASDLGRLRSHGREVLALQACHPRFFATQRYIVYAEPVRVAPRQGRPYTITARKPGSKAAPGT